MGSPVYVPHEIFERKPLLGVLLGVVSLGMCALLFAMALREYRGFGRFPEKVDLKTVTPPPEMLGKWVEVMQPVKVYCEPIEIENQAEHQLLFGRVESTNFLAEILGSQRFLVLQRSKKAKCEDVQGNPLVGVLTEVNPRLRSTLESKGMVFPRDRLVMLLCLTCGPKESRTYLIVFPIMIGASLWLINRSWRIHLRQTALRKGTSIGIR